MAELNILESSIRGKLGNTYGSKTPKGTQLKAVPFSHAPHTEKQKIAFWRHVCFRRFCCAQYMALKEYCYWPHPKYPESIVVGGYFQKMLQGAFFNINDIYTVCQKMNTVEILDKSFDVETRTFTLEYNLEDDREKGIPKETALCCFNGEYQTILQTHAEWGRHRLQFVSPIKELDNPCFCFTQYTKQKRGWKPTGAYLGYFLDETIPEDVNTTLPPYLGLE